MAASSDLVFAYGTLRRGFARHGLLSKLNARYVGEGTVQGDLFNLGRFPGAQRSKTNSAKIVGEIYRLTNSTHALKRLDEVEGYRANQPTASHFRRAPAEVLLRDGRRLTAWVYWFNRSPWPAGRIASGDYARP